MLLCSRHHRLVHEGGYRLQDMLDDEVDSSAVALNRHPSAEGLPARPLFVAERSPPAYLPENGEFLH